jgi:hypothetical protein
MKKLLFVAFIIYAIWKLTHSISMQPVVLEPGIKAPSPPEQVNIKQPESFIHKEDFRIIPLASFKLNGKVLSRKDYSYGPGAELSPVDFAMGWGEMSDETVLEQIDISQSGRWYRWRVEQFPIPRKKIETQSANMHFVPADDYVASQLEKVRQGEIIQAEGFLIRAEMDDGWRWQSSLTRNDTGDGACELFYVREIEVITP